jgi:hypothetical protein
VESAEAFDEDGIPLARRDGISEVAAGSMVIGASVPASYGGAPGAVARHSALIVVAFTSTRLHVAPVGSEYLNPLLPAGLPSATQPPAGKVMVSLAAPWVKLIAPPSTVGLSVLGSGSVKVPFDTTLVLLRLLFR